MSLFHDKVSPPAVIMSNLRHIQGLERLLEILEVFRKSACTGLLVKGRKVLSGLLHHLDHMIKGHAVLSIGESGVEIRVKGTGGGESVSLDTWDLYQAADRIAGHSQWCSNPISAAYSICEGLPPKSWHAAAEAIAHATPTSP